MVGIITFKRDKKMKKHIIGCLVAALSILSSCTKEEFVAPEPVDEKEYSGLEFTASLASKDSTKTTLESDGRTVKWHPSDAIKILPAANEWGYTEIPAAMTSISEDKKTATFMAEKKTHDYTPAFGVYPGSLTTELCDGAASQTSFIYTVPATQDGAFGSANLLAAKCDGNTLSFKNVGGIFKVRFNCTDGTALSIKGTGIAHKVKVTFTDGLPATTILEEGSDEITVKNVEYNTNYYIAVAPGTYSDLSLQVQNDKGREVITVKYPKTLTVTPGMLVDWDNLSGHAPAYLPRDFKKKLLDLKSLDCSCLRKITFVVNSLDPKQEDEIIMDEAGTPVYASYDAATQFVTIRTSAPEFKVRSGLGGMTAFFRDMYDLKEIAGFENVNTSDVTDMGSLFSNCQSLATIDFSKFETSNVEIFEALLCECRVLDLSDLSFLKVENATKLNGMFAGCKLLVNADLSSWETENATSVYAMFEGCINLETVKLPDHFVTKKANNTSNMFHNCKKLKTIDISKFDLSGVWDINSMFQGCESLILENESNFNPACSNASNAFAGCKSLTSVSIPKFGKNNCVKNLSYMFKGCSKLVSVDLSSLTTGNTTNMESMFAGCEKLSSLDLSTFNTENVTTFENMFNGAYRLAELNLGNDFTISNTAKAASPNIFGPSGKRMGYLTGNEPYTELTCSKSTFNQLSDILGDDIIHYTMKSKAYMPTGAKFNERILALRPGTDVTSMFFYTESDATDGTIINSDYMDKGPAIYAKMTEGGNVSVWTSAQKMSLNANCEGMFEDFYSMESISGLNCLTANDVTDMEMMFYDCSSLESIPGLENWNVSKVTTMESMFECCQFATLPNISGWAAPNLVSTKYMFASNENLTTLPDLGGLSSTKLTDMEGMFMNSYALESVTGLGDWNTTNVTNMKNLFSGCGALGNLSGLDKWNTAKVTNMSGLFNGCSTMTDFSFLTSWNTSSCTNMSYMLCAVGATHLDVGAFSTSNVTNMKAMFSWSEIKILNFGKSFNTKNVTDMSEMFSYCLKLEALNIGHFDTRKVSNFTEMFCGCNRIANLNIRGSNFVIDAKDTLTSIFGEAGNNYMGKENGVPYALISVSAENYARIASVMGDAMDYYIYNLPAKMPTGSEFKTYIGNLSRSKSIYPTSIVFSTEKVWSTAGAVRINECYDGLPIYMSLANDGKVSVWTPGNEFTMNADCSSMFHSTPTVGDEGARCQKVTEIIGTENWGMLGVTNMATMFYGCQMLTSCSFNCFYTANVTSMEGMFGKCYSLTEFNVSNWDTSNVTSMHRMFYYCTSLTNLELNTFNTSKVTSMSGMFAGCTILQNVNILKFDTKKVTNLSSMFYGCINLAQIIIGSKFFFDGKNTAEMFTNLGTNYTTPPYCTFHCNDVQKIAIEGILGAQAGNYAFSVKPADYLPGVFSVSATKKIRFSKGNLKATYDGSKYNWGFFDNQYDYTANTSGNETIDSQTSGKIVDLFGWSTAMTNYGISTSTSPDDYPYTFIDWGKTIDDKGTWRTITAQELSYLFSYETFANKTREGLCAKNVKVMGKDRCVILYPDGYTGVKVEDDDQTTYNSLIAWEQAQKEGVVCLPAAHRREGSDVGSEGGTIGYYWSSTTSTNNCSYGVMFTNASIFLQASAEIQRYTGCSVRLIMDAN